MVFRGLVEGGVDHVAADGALHVGHFLGALVDEQHDELDLGVVVRDGVGDLLQQRGFAGLGLGDDHAALALADGREYVDHAQRKVGLQRIFQPQTLVGIPRHQRLEGLAAQRLLRRLAVDFADVDQRAVAVALALGARLALHIVARAQPEAADLGDGDVHVPGTGQAVLRSQEAVAVGLNLQHARAVGEVAHGRAVRVHLIEIPAR